MPTKRALLQQQTGAQAKSARVDTVSSSAEEALARVGQAPDPIAVIAGGSTDIPTNSPNKRSSARLRESPNAKAKGPAITNKKGGSARDSPADFAAVEPVAETAMPLADAETTPSVMESAEIGDETVLSTKENEVLQVSAVRTTRSQNPKYFDESDDDLPTKSPKGKEVQQSSAVDTTTGEKVGLNMDGSDVEDMGEDEQTGDKEPSDEEPSDEEFKSPVKQQPAIAKLSRGRQRKPFSPSGNRTLTMSLSQTRLINTFD
jgi:hypothetical protein